MSSIALIVLAAGYSKRFGATNKLLAKVNGKPLLEQSLQQTAALPVKHKLAVINSSSEEVKNICVAAAFETIENHNAEQGIGSSIAIGAQHLQDKKVDAVMIALGDMPYVSVKTYQMLVESHRDNPDKTIIAPAYNGKRGHPVLFTAVHFDSLCRLTGDQGAKELINMNADTFLTLDVSDPGILADIDTAADLTR